MKPRIFILCAFVIAIVCLVQSRNVLAASTVSTCGTVITSSGTWTLSQNLTCTGSGIDIQSGNVTLKLNGFSITGPGMNADASGILIASPAGAGLKNVTVLGPGTIADFQNGVTFQGTKGGGAVDVTFSGNEIGILLTSDINTISPANLVLSQNNMLGGLNGITGQANTSALVGNNCSNLSDCINLVSSSGNRVAGNVGNGNNHAGIVIAANATGSTSANNIVEGNQTLNNRFYGIFIGPTASGTHVIGNIAFNNSFTDINEFNSHCGTDTFLNDAFGTSSQSCVK